MKLIQEAGQTLPAESSYLSLTEGLQIMCLWKISSRRKLFPGNRPYIVYAAVEDPKNFNLIKFKPFL